MYAIRRKKCQVIGLADDNSCEIFIFYTMEAVFDCIFQEIHFKFIMNSNEPFIRIEQTIMWLIAEIRIYM